LLCLDSPSQHAYCARLLECIAHLAPPAACVILMVQPVSRGRSRSLLTRGPVGSIHRRRTPSCRCTLRCFHRNHNLMPLRPLCICTPSASSLSVVCWSFVDAVHRCIQRMWTTLILPPHTHTHTHTHAHTYRAHTHDLPLLQSDSDREDAAERGDSFSEEVSDAGRSNAWGAAYDVDVPPVPVPAPTAAPVVVSVTEEAVDAPPQATLSFADRLKAMRERAQANVSKAAAGNV
jgi:hypothetical protein